MAAGAFTPYDFLCKYLQNGTVDLDTNTIMVALVKSTYTPDAVNHDTWSDVSGDEITNGNGYATGGVALASPVLAAVTRGWKFSTANAIWTASGGAIPAWRYAVFYAAGTVNSVVNPLIGYFVGDATPADIQATPDAGSNTLACPAAGWFAMTH